MRPLIAITLFLMPFLFSCATKYHGPVVTDQGTIFRFKDPGVKSVSLVGNFNHWNSEQHRLAGPDGKGWWSTTVPLSPGQHEYLFLVNGSELVLDPAVPLRVDDGYGGKNSLLIIR